MADNWTFLGAGVQRKVKDAILELRGAVASPAGCTYYVDGDTGASGNTGLDWDNALDTIQGAVDKCGNGLGDVIYVAPHKYQENVLILDHAGIKIIATHPGWTTRVRASDGATKYPFTPVGGTLVPGACFIVLSQSVTIEGFCLDAGGGYAGVYVGDGYVVNATYDENSASVRIQGNHFVGGTEGLYGVCLDGCSDNVVVENNTFSQFTTAGIYITPGGTRTVQRAIIRDNEFIDVAGYGVDMYSHATTVGVLIKCNSFNDGVSTTMTYGVRCQGAGVHSIVGNWFACANAISASSTDFTAGNYMFSAGNAPHFVQDSTNSA